MNHDIAVRAPTVSGFLSLPMYDMRAEGLSSPSSGMFRMVLACSRSDGVNTARRQPLIVSYFYDVGRFVMRSTACVAVSWSREATTW